MLRWACRKATTICVEWFAFTLFLTHVASAFAQARNVISSSVLSTSLAMNRQLPFMSTDVMQRGRTSFQTILDIRGGQVATTTSSPLISTLVSNLGAALLALNTAWKAQNPFVIAAVVCATKAVAADLVAQQRQLRIKSKSDQEAKFDVRRNISFMVYGALYQGVAQEFIYNNLYTTLFGSASTPRVVVSKVLFDAIFHNALVCIPMAYLVKGFIYKHSPRQAIKQYIDDVMNHGLLKKYYAIWMPVNCMIFAVVPKHMRLTFMAMVSFFWMTILSTISSRNRDTDDSASINSIQINGAKNVPARLVTSTPE